MSELKSENTLKFCLKRDFYKQWIQAKNIRQYLDKLPKAARVWIFQIVLTHLKGRITLIAR